MILLKPGLLGVVVLLITSNCQSQTKKMEKDQYPITKTEAEWKAELTPEEYNILREKGTERAFTGKYWHNEEDGFYYCAACNSKLFSSDAKYESGSGWPSFWKAAKGANIKVIKDTSLGMVREEIVCGNCGGHLGHRFNDGPQPTGERYCINSASLEFKKSAGKN